jgi:hypothetical protein
MGGWRDDPSGPRCRSGGRAHGRHRAGGPLRWETAVRRLHAVNRHRASGVPTVAVRDVHRLPGQEVTTSIAYPSSPVAAGTAGSPRMSPLPKGDA